MYMKNLKPIIFMAHSELKPDVPSIKKSHLYEAFAAFCGFKSYAAFQVASNCKVENLELANRQCFERLEGLGLGARVALKVCQRIQQAWEQFNIISLDDVYAFFNKKIIFFFIDIKLNVMDKLPGIRKRYSYKNNNYD